MSVPPEPATLPSVDRERKPLPDDSLPPVTPPAAGFILQLFFIPLVIVSIIVTVWLLFSWLAQMGNDPKDLVRDLRKLNKGSWQKALTLADLLRNKQYEHLKHDPEMAQEIAELLDNQLDQASFDPERIKLRVFLCRVLGEFHVPNGLPALVKASTLQRHEDEIGVRLSAIEALSLLCSNLGPVEVGKHPEVLPALSKAATEKPEGIDKENQIAELRSRAAFALGVIGGDEALKLLDRMQSEDPHANARFNAATGLARHGDLRAKTGLLQMLDPDNEDTAGDEPNESAKRVKRMQVQVTGIRTVKLLAKKRPESDLSELQAAIEKLQAAKVEITVKTEAAEALFELKGKK